MVVTSNTRIERKYDGDVAVQAGTLEVNGMITGNVVLEGTACLVLHGMVNGNVTVGASASAEIAGTVGGVVINMGNLRVSGSIGKLDDIAQSAIIGKGSVVGGVKV